MVVDGTTELNGSDGARARQVLTAEAQRPKAAVQIARTASGLQVDVTGAPHSAGVYLAIADNAAESQVGAGENHRPPAPSRGHSPHSAQTRLGQERRRFQPACGSSRPGTASSGLRSGTGPRSDRGRRRLGSVDSTAARWSLTTEPRRTRRKHGEKMRDCAPGSPHRFPLNVLRVFLRASAMSSRPPATIKARARRGSRPCGAPETTARRPSARTSAGRTRSMKNVPPRRTR